MPLRTLGLLEAPTPVATRGGLLPVSRVIDSSNNEFYHQTGVVQIATCEVPQQAPYDCFANLQIADAPKDSHGIFSSETTTFSLYFAVDCYLQADEQEFATRAREGLLAGESTGIEKVGQGLLNAITTTATATGIVDAIGKAESYAGRSWGHLPLIHMDRELATDAIAANVLAPGLDWTLTTLQGTPVNNAGGFTPQNTIWVTGPATIVRGPISTYRAVDAEHNREVVLAERSYAMWIDCGGLKITVNAPAQQQEPTPGTPLALTIGTVPASPISAGTDVSVHVHTNYAPPGEVVLSVANAAAGPWTSLGEMTAVTSDEFISNFETDGLAGQTKYLRAAVGSVQSSVIAVDIT